MNGLIAFTFAASLPLQPIPLDAYVAKYGEELCSIIAANPTKDGLDKAGQVVITKGSITSYDSGWIVGKSITDYCPRFIYMAKGYQ